MTDLPACVADDPHPVTRGELTALLEAGEVDALAAAVEERLGLAR
jgi:hypothetical protein